MASKANKTAQSGAPQLILSVNSPSNYSTQTQATLLYSVIDSNGELATTAPNYSAATGIYTVPAAGHKNVRILAKNSLGSVSAVQGYLEIQINGVAVARKYTEVSAATSSPEVDFYCKNLIAGDQVKVVANPKGVNNISVGAKTDMFQIFATQ